MHDVCNVSFCQPVKAIKRGKGNPTWAVSMAFGSIQHGLLRIERARSFSILPFSNPGLCKILPTQNSMGYGQANYLEKKCMGYLTVGTRRSHHILALCWKQNILMMHRIVSPLKPL